MQKKIIFPLFAIFTLMAFMMASPATQPRAVLAADGSNGTITAGFFSAFYDVPIEFWVEDLDVSSDYGVAWGASTFVSQFNFTTGAAQTTFSFKESFQTTDTTTGDSLTIGLWPGSLCNSSSLTGSAIDFFQIQFTQLAEAFPTGFFIELGVALILVLIVAAIVVGLIRSGKK